jgi:hypothetical protein
MNVAALAFECSGEVDLGEVAAESRKRLSGFAGEWLEFDGAARRIVVRHVQPGGTPALSAVPAELIAMLQALAPDERERMRGGALVVRDRAGVLLRLVVEPDEVRIQWPKEDWSHASQVPLAEALALVEPVSARVSGALRFHAASGARTKLVEFIESFEGLYPDSDLRLEREGSTVRVELEGVCVGPQDLLDKLHELADPPASLDGDLRVSSFAPHALDRDYRLHLRGGVARAERPALWREG